MCLGSAALLERGLVAVLFNPEQFHACVHTDTAPSEAVEAGDGGASKGGSKKKLASSWDAKEAGSAEGTQEDFLSNLGTAQNYNINVSHGKNACLMSRFFCLMLCVPSATMARSWRMY